MHRRIGFVCLFAWLAATPALAHVVWRADFETADLSQWTDLQQVSSDRLTVVQSPVAQGQYAVRVLLKQGDDPIGASGNRTEMAQHVLQSEDTESYYRWYTLFPSTYPSDKRWQVFTQWHQDGCCGVPPIEFDVVGEQLELISGPSETVLWSAPLERGRWHEFIFHVKWSSDPGIGFVELYYDGSLALPKQYLATGADTYLKQGLYRDSRISADAVVFHDGMIQATSLDDVRPPPPPRPPPDAGAVAAAQPDGGSALPRSGTGLSNDVPGSPRGPLERRLVVATSSCSTAGSGAAAPLGALVLIALARFRRQPRSHRR